MKLGNEAQACYWHSNLLCCVNIAAYYRGIIRSQSRNTLAPQSALRDDGLNGCFKCCQQHDGALMFSENIVWTRLNVQDGGRTRLSITKEKSNLLLPHYAFKNTVLLLALANFEHEPNSGAQWQTLQRKQQMRRTWTDIVLKTSCEVCSHFHFFSSL